MKLAVFFVVMGVLLGFVVGLFLGGTLMVRSGAEGYVCTAEQLESVARETEICSETGYLSDFCFRNAKKIYCTPKEQQCEE